MGNPIIDQINKSNFSFNYSSSKPIIALLPGSRKQEIESILPEMISLVNNFIKYQFVIAATNIFSREYYQSFIGDCNIGIVFNQTYGLLKNSHAALVASGTATLEVALLIQYSTVNDVIVELPVFWMIISGLEQTGFFLR